MTTTRLPTEFLPAERVAMEVVQRQAALIAGCPLTPQLLDSVLNHVVILNAHRQIVFASRNTLGLASAAEVTQLLGRRPGEMMGCVRAGENLDACGTSAFCTQCGAAQAIGESLEGRPTVRECRMTRVVDGRIEALDLLVYAAPFRHEGESFTVFTIQDLSDRKRREALERTFFHDLINSVGGLEGLMALVREEAPLPLQPDLDLAQATLQDLREEVFAHRDLAAAERDELAVTPARLEAGPLLEQVATLYRHHPVSAGCTVRVAPESVALTLVSDPRLLRRVLGNLVKNALEATEPGGTVTVAVEEAGERVRFSVHNPGAMPLVARLQVFNRSFSTKGAGRGLGTYSVKLLTERYLEGVCSFATSAEAGTTFFVDVPRILRQAVLPQVAPPAAWEGTAGGATRAQGG